MAGGRQLGLEGGRLVWSNGDTVEPGGTIETLDGEVLGTYTGVAQGFKMCKQISDERSLGLDQLVMSPNCLKELPEIQLRPRSDS
jgi:hypothetical protein